MLKNLVNILGAFIARKVFLEFGGSCYLAVVKFLFIKRIIEFSDHREKFLSVWWSFKHVLLQIQTSMLTLMVQQFFQTCSNPSFSQAHAANRPTCKTEYLVLRQQKNSFKTSYLFSTSSWKVLWLLDLHFKKSNNPQIFFLGSPYFYDFCVFWMLGILSASILHGNILSNCWGEKVKKKNFFSSNSPPCLNKQ